MSAINRPLVTVITPTFNRAAYLRETITSVLNQGYPNIEYIVLDDGSTDDTLAVVGKYRDRLTYVSHTNMGEPRTVNRGLQMANGEFIAVVNSDDPVLPGLIESAVEALEEDPSIWVAYPDWLMIDEHSKVLRRIRTYEYDYSNMVRWHHCFPGPGACFRREAIEGEGGRDPRYRYVADFEFWLRLGLHRRFARIPEPLATFRVHAGSASVAEAGLQMAEEHILLVRRFFSRKDVPDNIRRHERESFAAAYYIAGIQCQSSHASVARMYFLRSYLLSLRCRPNGLRRSIVPPLRTFSVLRRALRVARDLRSCLGSMRKDSE